MRHTTVAHCCAILRRQADVSRGCATRLRRAATAHICGLGLRQRTTTAYCACPRKHATAADCHPYCPRRASAAHCTTARLRYTTAATYCGRLPQREATLCYADAVPRRRMRHTSAENDCRGNLPLRRIDNASPCQLECGWSRHHVIRVQRHVRRSCCVALRELPAPGSTPRAGRRVLLTQGATVTRHRHLHRTMPRGAA